MLHQVIGLVSLLAVGPELDPIAGEWVGPEARRLLPAPRHLGSVADLWFVDLVSLQMGGGGIDLFDPLALSAHGRASSQMHYRLGDLDISDPARPGTALLDVPHDSWQRLAFRSLWTAQPGFTWEVGLADEAPTGAWAALRYGAPVGGGVWFPRHLFDRDPGFAWGVGRNRRALTRAREVTGAINLRPAWGPLQITGEYLDHTHAYPSLRAADGGPQPEGASRGSLLLWQRLQLADLWPLQLTLAWQGRQRAHAGGQARLPLGLTQRQASQAVLAQLQLSGELTGLGRLSLALGGAWRGEQQRAHDAGPQAVDLLDAWLWLSRPEPAADGHRWRGDLNARLQLAALPLELQLLAQLQRLHQARRPFGGRLVTTYQKRPIRELRYDPPQVGETWLRGSRLQATWAPSWDGLRLQLLAGLDYGGLGSRNGPDLDFLTPVVGANLRLPLGAGELFALVRREPEALTAQASNFLDPSANAGHIYARLDDGPATEPGQLGAELRRTGGPYHAPAPGLRRPLSYQLAFGGRTPPFGPFRFLASAVGRWLQDRFTVDLATPGGWQPVGLADPGGDGRGETPIPGGGQALTAYARDPRTWGSERYLLSNAREIPFYGGLELNLVSEPGRAWFLNLGGAAYLSRGAAPFGHGPDRNDPGAVDESSADLNQTLNALGRYDHDRAFTLKLLAGIMPLPGLTLSTAARYRDGQPFTRLLAATQLPQGPTAIMAVARGKPRATFHMTWDVRLRYARPLGPCLLALVGDVYNLLGSAAEINEDPRTGPTFRRALEGVPDRAVLVSLELSWSTATPGDTGLPSLRSLF